MKHTLFRLIAIVLIATMLLSACQQQTTPEDSQPTEETNVDQTDSGDSAPAETGSYENVDPSGQSVIFWHNHTRDREEALNEIIDEFNKTNEWGITVSGEYQGNYGPIFNKVLTFMGTPDIAQLVVAYQNQSATYQIADTLVDMNALVNSEKWGLSEEEQADFFPSFFNQDVFSIYGGQRLGFPPNRSMEVMYYNMDWLTELGYDAPPKTPEQFKEIACKAVEQPFSKYDGEGSIGYELSLDASRFASWTFAFGGNVFDYGTNSFTYDSDEAQSAMVFIQELFTEECATIVTEDYGDQTDFGAGKLLFSIGSTSGLPFYGSAVDEGAQFNWSVAPIPYTTSEPVMNVYGASVTIPKTTPEQELAAWLFVKYYTSPEIQAKWARVSNYFPVRASVADGLSDYFDENPAYKAAFDLLQYATFEPPVPGYDFVRDKVREEMASIVDGDDVASTLETLNTNANTILQENLTSVPTPAPIEEEE